MAAVENLCQRVIWIADGTVRRDGEDVIAAYLSSIGGTLEEGVNLRTIKERRGTGIWSIWTGQPMV